MLRKETSLFELEVKPMETEKTTWLEFPKGGKATLKQILQSEETNKSKRAQM